MFRFTRTRPLAALIVPLLATTLLLAGCGSDDGGSGPTDDARSSGAPATSPTGAPEVSEEFRTCLEDQGVELPTGQPTERPTEGDLPSRDPQMQEAIQACASLAPSGGPAGAGGPGEIDQSALEAFADCMADNGVTVEATLEAVTSLDQDDKQVSKALETCAPLIQP